MQKANIELSHIVAENWSKYIEKHQCYKNSLLISILENNYRLFYVEGYVARIIPMEHAWLETESGDVIDPTFAWLDMNGHTESDSLREVVYFKAKRFENSSKLINKVLPMCGWTNRELYENYMVPAYEAVSKHMFGSKFRQIQDLLQETANEKKNSYKDSG